MASRNYCCFVGKKKSKKKVKAYRRSAVYAENIEALASLQDEVDHPFLKSFENVEFKSTSFGVFDNVYDNIFDNIPDNSMKVMNPVAWEVKVAACEREDEGDSNSDSTNSSQGDCLPKRSELVDEHFANELENDANNAEEKIEVIEQGGHMISDPHETLMDRDEHRLTRGRQRSCSSLDTTQAVNKIIAYEKPPLKSKSFSELYESLKAGYLESLKQQGGYANASDTCEPSQVNELCKLESYKSGREEIETHKYEGLTARDPTCVECGEVLLLEVKSTTSLCNGDDDNTEEVTCQPSPEVNGPIARDTNLQSSSHTKVNLSKEPLEDANIMTTRTPNSSSTIAHISGMSLKVVPMISQFISLRSVNLSNNSIVQITPGSLPKGLHSLDLSRNKICTIAGLNELTKLRLLNLSYNRISKLGYEVANFRLLKELHLAGNKISEVEGLHRLQKLTVLDLSFNKITTTKSMGQIVANYSSMLSLNLTGNPIQRTLSEQQLQKAICGLLPKLAYLNKQPVNKNTKALGASKDILGKNTYRSNNWSVHGRVLKKTSQSSKNSLGIVQKSISKTKNRTNIESCLKIRT